MNLDKIIEEQTGLSIVSLETAPMDRKECRDCMREACRQALKQAIKSFPSHEHPEIAKAIMNVMEEIE